MSDRRETSDTPTTSLEQVINLGNQITSLRSKRATIEDQFRRQMGDIDSMLNDRLAELARLIGASGVRDGDNGHRPEVIAAKPSARAPLGYIKGSVAHRILVALSNAPAPGLTGAALSSFIGAENKQVHAMLSRLVPANHVARETEGGSSVYTITPAGREALANAREGGKSNEDEAPSTA